MSVTLRAGDRESQARVLLASLAFVVALTLVVQVSLLDLESTGAVVLAAIVVSLGLAAWRPHWGALVTLALFSDALYFGTYGVRLPVGQFTTTDVLFLAWWALALAAGLWLRKEIVPRSPMMLAVGVLYPALLACYFCYTHLGFGADMQEMLRCARPFLYMTLVVPLSLWLGSAGALDKLLKAALGLALGAVLLQLGIYTLGVDVEPYGLFYEWQVWRNSFEGFDRSNQPFFGLNLILIAGLVTMAFRDESRLRRQAWSAGAGLLLISALISFGRGFWAAMVIAVMTAVVVEKRSGRRSSMLALGSAAILACLVLALVAGAAGSNLGGLLDAVRERGALGATSIRYLDGTLGDRYDHINQAVIREHPLMGIGFFLALGTAAEVDLADPGHNLYADLMLRMGVVGLAAFASLLWIFLKRCRTALALELSLWHRAAVVGCVGGAFGNLAWAVSSSHMIARRGMFEMALMMAVVELVIRSEADSAPARGQA